TNDCVAMIDAFGAIGPRHWRGKRARDRAEQWIEVQIDTIRKDKDRTIENTPAHVIAHYNTPDGKLLDKRLAAVELINMTRPVVAISYYVVFAALALHQYPDCREKINSGGEE